MNPELRHLRAFVALAEELNFTRAAQRLHLAQQALSAQIQQLEERVGAQLVTRTTRKVELTAAGEALYAQAPGVLAALDAATEAARGAARGETGWLRIGLLATAALDFTPLVLRAFTAERPGVELSVRNVDFSDPTGGVRSGDTDVAVVWLPFATDGLVVEPLFDEERVGLLADDHPLAAKPELRAADLAGEPMGWVEGLDTIALDFWTLAEHRRGPDGAGVAITGFDDYLAAIRAGRAVAAVPASIARSLPWSRPRPARDRRPRAGAGGRLPSRRRRESARRRLRPCCTRRRHHHRSGSGPLVRSGERGGIHPRRVRRLVGLDSVLVGE